MTGQASRRTSKLLVNAQSTQILDTNNVTQPLSSKMTSHLANIAQSLYILDVFLTYLFIIFITLHIPFVFHSASFCNVTKIV